MGKCFVSGKKREDPGNDVGLYLELVSLQQTNLQKMADFGEGHTCLEYGKSYNNKMRLEKEKRFHKGEVGL